MEIAKGVREQTAARAAERVLAAHDPKLLPEGPQIEAAKALTGLITGAGPAPKAAKKAAAPTAKKAVVSRPRRVARKKLAPAAPTPKRLAQDTYDAQLRARINAERPRLRAENARLRSEVRQERVLGRQGVAAERKKTEFAEGMRRAEAESAAARRKKVQRTAAGAAGGTAAVGAAAGGAVAARQAYRARKLRHMPAPGLNNSQKALVGVGAGATGGMLLAQRRRES